MRKYWFLGLVMGIALLSLSEVTLAKTDYLYASMRGIVPDAIGEFHMVTNTINSAYGRKRLGVEWA
jgi:hypothetical protein